TLTSGELVIDKSITISGPGSNLLTVSRSSSAANFRIVHITPNHNVIIGGLTISGGNGAPNGSGLLNDHATLTLESCVVQNNNNPAQSGHGGGIWSSSVATVTKSIISDNHTAYNGGGISNNGTTTTLTIVDSLISGNVAEADFVSSGVVFASGDGGGIYNNATLAITNST